MILASSESWRPQRHTSAALIVLVLHAVIALMLLQLGAWPDRATPPVAMPPLVVQILPMSRLLPPPEATRPAVAPLRPLSAPRASRRSPAAPQNTAITLPPPAAAAEPAAETSAAVPALTTPMQTPQLNLNLPRSASAPWRRPRNAALDDPRSNTARATFDSRLRDAMGGDGVWVEERLDNDHVRFRRGGECVEMKRSRAGQLDLANGAVRDLWAGKRC